MEIDYNRVIGLLKSESDRLIEELKANKTHEIIYKKLEIEGAIKWLRKGMDFQINPDSKVVMIPEQKTKTPSSEFRIIEDHESDNKDYWTEVKLNDDELRPSPGDFLIMR